MIARAAGTVALVGCLLLTSACGLSFQNLPIGRSAGSDAYRITVVFDNAANLPIGGKVKLGQAVVGRISELAERDFRAHVTVSLDRDTRIPAGTKARLELNSPLGKQFIHLLPPDGPESRHLRPGSTIGVEHTSRGVDVEQLLSALGGMLGGAGLDQVQTIVRETTEALRGRGDTVRTLFGRTEKILGSIERHSEHITGTLRSLDRLTSTLNSERATLRAGLTEITPAIRTLNAQRGRFGQLLGHVRTLSEATTDLLDATGDGLVRQVRQLRPVLDELAAVERDLGSALEKIRPFRRYLARAAPGDYLNVDGTVDVPSTLLPLLTGNPPPPPGSRPPQPGGIDDLLSRGNR